MKKVGRIFGSAFVLTLLLFSIVVTPVLAIDDPDSISINAVYAYRHCLETGDQLYLVDYTVSYTINPDENITTAYIGRLMNGTVELGNTTPYAYYDEGYDRGIFAIYLSASEAPAWAGAYTIKLVGNPTLTWAGAPPSDTESTIYWSTSTGIGSTQTELGDRILYYADLLEQEWAINMIDTDNSGFSYLSEYGADYFSNSIENLNLIAPNIFTNRSLAPDWESNEQGTSYAATLADMANGTMLDASTLAAGLGIGRVWLTTILALIGSLYLAWKICEKVQSNRPLIPILLVCMIVGSLIGWVHLLLVVLVTFTMLVLLGWALFYHPSTA